MHRRILDHGSTPSLSLQNLLSDIKKGRKRRIGKKKIRRGKKEEEERKRRGEINKKKKKEEKEEEKAGRAFELERGRSIVRHELF